MTEGHKAAINRFCREKGCSKDKLLDTLKERGAVDSGAALEVLGSYVNEQTFYAMWHFLEENFSGEERKI